MWTTVVWLTYRLLGFSNRLPRSILLEAVKGNLTPCHEREDPRMVKWLEDRNKWSVFAVEDGDR